MRADGHAATTFTGPVNLGNPAEFTMRELAEQVIALTGLALADRVQAAARRRPAPRRPDIALAREVLGWQPTVSLEAGLVKTIEYFDRLLQHARVQGPRFPERPRQAARGLSPP